MKLILVLGTACVLLGGKVMPLAIAAAHQAMNIETMIEQLPLEDLARRASGELDKGFQAANGYMAAHPSFHGGSSSMHQVSPADVEALAQSD